MEPDAYDISRHWREGPHPGDVREAWIRRAIEHPDRVARQPARDNPLRDRLHYIKAIAEAGGKYLRVIVDPDATAKPRVIAAYFDRALGRRQPFARRRR